MSSDTIIYIENELDEFDEDRLNINQIWDNVTIVVDNDKIRRTIYASKEISLYFQGYSNFACSLTKCG